MKTIASYSNLEDAFLARSRLEGSGVDSYLPDELSATNSPAQLQILGGIRLQVQDEDFDRACAVLGLRTHAHCDLTCPQCGSHNVKIRDPSLVAALCTSLGLRSSPRSRTADCLDCRRSFEAK